MDIEIGEVRTNLKATDSEALLSPDILRPIVIAVLAELREQDAYNERRRLEHGLNAGVTRQRPEIK